MKVFNMITDEINTVIDYSKRHWTWFIIATLSIVMMTFIIQKMAKNNTAYNHKIEVQAKMLDEKLNVKPEFKEDFDKLENEKVETEQENSTYDPLKYIIILFINFFIPLITTPLVLYAFTPYPFLKKIKDKDASFEEKALALKFAEKIYVVQQIIVAAFSILYLYKS